MKCCIESCNRDRKTTDLWGLFCFMFCWIYSCRPSASLKYDNASKLKWEFNKNDLRFFFHTHNLIFQVISLKCDIHSALSAKQKAAGILNRYNCQSWHSGPPFLAGQAVIPIPGSLARTHSLPESLLTRHRQNLNRNFPVAKRAP